MSRQMLLRRTLSFGPTSIAALSTAVAAALSGCAEPSVALSVHQPPLEDIHLLRSIRESQTPEIGWCAASRTGFEPFPTDAERHFSFWSIRSRPEDGRVVDSKQARVAELRACFGPTAERARQNFYAEIRLGSLSFRGHGDCLAAMTDFPEPGLFPVGCRLVLSGLPAPFSGGLLTTNTMASGARFGGATEPPGYTQASIATLRLWKARSGP